MHRNQTGEHFAMSIVRWRPGKVDGQKRRRLFTQIFGHFNGIKVWNSNILISQKYNKNSNSFADRQQTSTKKSRVESCWTSTSPFGITYSASKLLSAQFFPSTLHVHADWQSHNSKAEVFNQRSLQPRYVFYGMWRYVVY